MWARPLVLLPSSLKKRPLCRGTLIVTEHFLDENSQQAQPLMLYAG